VNVRTQKVEIEAFAQSKDLQEVTVKTSVNYHIDPTQAAELYDELGGNYEETVIAPAVLQRTDAEVGLIEALDFAAKRGELATNIQAALELQLGGYGIVVEYVNIEDAIFQSAFIQAVEVKVIAGQTVETELRLIDAAKHLADQVVEAAEGEAAAIIAVANAQANANDVIDASLTSDVLLWQRILQWDGILPSTLLGASDSLDVLVEIPAG
jgi:regulator of protease activity HflC (stomatin/prohibitin superfamily)